jgi:hypothetical protein
VVEGPASGNWFGKPWVRRHRDASAATEHELMTVTGVRRPHGAKGVNCIGNSEFRQDSGAHSACQLPRIRMLGLVRIQDPRVFHGPDVVGSACR